jgi:hypothetical protein
MRAIDFKAQTVGNICEWQNDGWNVFIGMNAFTPGRLRRRKQDVHTVRNLYLDIDENAENAVAKITADAVLGIIPEPHFILKSSPLKRYVIWQVKDLTVPQAEAMLRALAQRYGGDPASTDTPRVLRLPGTRNLKYDPAPRVEIVQQTGQERFSPGDFKIDYNVKEQVDHTADPEKQRIRAEFYDTACAQAGVDAGEFSEKEGAYRYEMDSCPNAAKHTDGNDGGASVMIYPSGKISFGCFHAHCVELGWADFYRPWMQSKAKENGCTGFLRFGTANELVADPRTFFDFTTTQVGVAVPQISPISPSVSPLPSSVMQSPELDPFVTVDGDLFMQESIPPRKVLVRTISNGEPVFFGPSINQIFAWRGMGKTNLGFGLAGALARGESFLNWEATEGVKVLYVEGELPSAQVQERWRQIVGQTYGNAKLITIDKQPNKRIASLSTVEGMERLEKTLAHLESNGFKTEVLFLDSISTLFNVTANDEENWIVIQAWLISLRSRGLCIFFFHHAGKSGLSRSHSKSEDMLDVSLKLEAPKEPEAGCLHAVLTYDKARAGLSERPIEIRMRRRHSENCRCKLGSVIGCPGDSVSWQFETMVNIKKADAIALFEAGISIRQVAKELKASPGTVATWHTKWNRDKCGSRAVTGMIQ